MFIRIRIYIHRYVEHQMVGGSNDIKRIKRSGEQVLKEYSQYCCGNLCICRRFFVIFNMHSLRACYLRACRRVNRVSKNMGVFLCVSIYFSSFIIRCWYAEHWTINKLLEQIVRILDACVHTCFYTISTRIQIYIYMYMQLAFPFRDPIVFSLFWGVTMCAFGACAIVP